MNGSCVVGAKHDEAIKALQEKTAEMQAVDERQWEAIDAIRDRPPVWATFVISGLAAAFGVAVTVAVTAIF